MDMIIKTQTVSSFMFIFNNSLIEIEELASSTFEFADIDSGLQLDCMSIKTVKVGN